MELLLEKDNKQLLGQRMFRSMSILQMGTDELEQTMHELSMENPLLDEIPQTDRDHLYRSGGRTKTHAGLDIQLPIPEKVHRTLKMSLIDQLRSMHLSPDVDRAVRLLLLNLDEKGFLSDQIQSTAQWQTMPESFSQALSILQGLEPAGVGAKDTAECLRIQLERMGLRDTAAYWICKDYFLHLLRNHINHIAKALGVEESEVISARDIIAKLNPIPANGYDDGKCTIWATPDVEIRFENGEPLVIKLDDRIPEYRINKYYEDLGNSKELTEEERAYLKEKIAQAKWAISCMKRRKETIVACAEAIARVQQEFFETGQDIHPCSMNDIAARMGVHPSTVSRTVKDKFVACKWGVFPMSYFFTHEISGESVQQIVEVLRQMIQEEDPKHPLSDSSLCKALEEKGIQIARRTVAKYRDQAGIPPATARKSR